MLDNIPSELRQLNQWVCSGSDKIPLNPRTGAMASVIEPSTWGTFQEACQAGYPNVGFVLTENDPYAIIDLDAPKNEGQVARHSKILAHFKTYAEVSQSGQGVHIVMRGAIPSGVRRDRVELYSSERYMIFTGRTMNEFPIVDYTETLLVMHQEMASTAFDDLVEEGVLLSDDEVLTRASNATNAAKFNALCEGNFEATHASQSEADFALLAMLCFYSKSNEQVRRLFRYSALGQREKATKNDVYLDRCLGKIRAAQQKPRVDLSAFLALEPPVPAKHAEAPPPPPAPVFAPAPAQLDWPPGLVGEVARHILATAIRPVPEIALAAAISFVAGIVGRCYNISNTGLNQYVILLAKTGTGKEGAASGVENLMSYMRQSIPAADEFIGPGTFASGQALIRVLDKSPSFVSFLGEFGLTLQQICSPTASSAERMLRRVLLDLFAKSGFSNVLRPSVYSDQEKNTQMITAPNVSIFGEGTPESFFKALDATHIAEGLIPRFLVIQYDGGRVQRNRNTGQPPQPQLLNQLADVITCAVAAKQNAQCMPVRTSHDAQAYLDSFDQLCDQKINNGSHEVEVQIWNRAHIKALKLAALVAVGCNHHNPVVEMHHAEWAVRLVLRDVEGMVTKFKSGDVGEGDHQKENDIRDAVEKYAGLSQEQRQQYKVPKKLLDKQVIPYAYLKCLLRLRASFKNDRRGAAVALQSTVDDLVRSGTLRRVPAEQAKETYGVDAPIYLKGESW